jgi:Asp/Glu/hydantoin racemase
MPVQQDRLMLAINPNTTTEMTAGLKSTLANPPFEYFTAQSGVASINNEEDGAVSSIACMPDLIPLLDQYDAFLVCCYSAHSLVPALRARLHEQGLGRKPVVGIFEASVLECLALLDTGEPFGIVSTGSQWTRILDQAVADLLGSGSSTRYAGTETTGLNADELHTTAKVQVDQLMSAAVKRLLDRGAKAICLGCAGMTGMFETVQSACIDHLGEMEGKRIRIIDGVIAGGKYLNSAIRALS